MAARRLIIVMLVLLGISTAIAIIAPDPVERSANSGTTGSTSPKEAGDDGPTGTTGQTGETGTTGGSDTTGEGGTTGGTGNDGATGATWGTGATGEGGAASSGASPGTVELAFTASGRPRTLCARPGSRVILTVRSTEPLDVSMPDFGRTASVTQYSPAIFDLLMPETPGSYEVEVLATGRELATIVGSSDCRRQA